MNSKVVDTTTIDLRSMNQPERMQAAMSLIPLIEAEADEAERINHLTDKTVSALREQGFFHLLLPRELGGPQLSYVDAMEITELMAWADGSAGWYVMVAGAIAASMGAYLPDEGAKEVYGSNPFTMAAGQGVPRGQATRVDGGYRIRGPWSYGSTIYHADFAHCGCMIMENGKPKLRPNGEIDAIVCHFPTSEIDLNGNWNTLGLIGTGSFDYDLKNGELFVPDHMWYPFVGVPPSRGGMQYSIGIVGFTSWCHTSWALGVARRALDEVAALAPSKASVFGVLGDGAAFKQEFAKAESKYRGARALVYDVWGEIEETLQKGDEVDVQQIALARMAMRYIHDVGSEVTNFAYRYGGGVSLRPSVLQRAYRDMHAGTQHVLLSDQIYQECSRVLLGMIGKNPRWTAFAVVDDGPLEGA